MCRSLVGTIEAMFVQHVPAMLCQLCSRPVPLRWTALERHIAEHSRTRSTTHACPRTPIYHTGNLPFKCTCSAQFYEVAELHAHMRQVHNSDVCRFVYVANFAADTAFGANIQRAFPALTVEYFETIANPMPHTVNTATDWQALVMNLMQQVGTRCARTCRNVLSHCRRHAHRYRRVGVVTSRPFSRRHNCYRPPSVCLASMILHAQQSRVKCATRRSVATCPV
jgi:hypothetical protein